MSEQDKGPLGNAIFGMMKAMGEAQARIRREGGTDDDVRREVQRLESLHRPKIMNTIVRPSEGGKHEPDDAG